MKVSVCLASYNGEKYIKEQLMSILPQLGESDELIISDDGSKDETIKIIESIEDPRIKLIHNKDRHGCIGNFENALKSATGDYIFLSDQDDVWLSGKYQEVCSLLENNDLVVTDSYITGDQLNILENSFFKYFKSGKGLIKNIIRSSYYGSCMAFNSRILNLSLPFPNTKEIGHDLWIGLVSEMSGKVLFYPKPLLLYRRHQSVFCNIGVGSPKKSRSLFNKIWGRVVILTYVIKFRLKN